MGSSEYSYNETKWNNAKIFIICDYANNEPISRSRDKSDRVLSDL